MKNRHSEQSKSKRNRKQNEEAKLRTERKIERTFKIYKE